MKRLKSFVSASSVFGPALGLATLLFPAMAAAAPNPTEDDGAESTPRDAAADDDRSRWSMNFTPVLLLPRDEYRWGGGADPELRYTFDLGSVHLSVGGRWGAYYAKNLFGTMAMPTFRLMVPVGSVEPYLSVGGGYGWLPKLEHHDFATLARLGTVVRFSKKFAIGIEGSWQAIDDSDFRFPSLGSMVAFDL